MTEQEMMKLASENYVKMLEEDRLNANIAEAVAEINNILECYGIEDRIEEDDICFTLSTLTEKLVPIKTDDGLEIQRKRRLGDIIFNHYSGELPSTTFYHYTSFSSFENILRTKKLWLYSMIKRFSEGEYISFYIDHDINGPIVKSAETNERIRQLLSDTYYISFARASQLTKEEEDDLWRSFGDDGSGVRLEFEIKAKYRDFRNIHYNDPSKLKSELLFNVLKDRIESLYNKKLVFAGLSKIGCFYLQGDFNTEYETRLLIKKNTDEYDFDYTIYKDENGIQLLTLEFENSIADIKLLSVQPGYLVDSENVNSVLEKYPLNTKPTIIDRAYR